jgi:hypothetical protein
MLKMKFRILFDNYYFYLILFGFASIFEYVVINKKISIGLLIVLVFIWVFELLSEKKMYLLSLKINETHIEVTYLNHFLKVKKFVKEKELIRSTNYLKNKSVFNNFDVLQIVEKSNSNVLNFKIIGKTIQENVQKIII